jgi:hypothetical protein
VFIVTLADSVTAAWKFPDDEASQPLTAVCVSPFVPAQLAHLGRVPFALTLDPDALAQVVAFLVVTDDTLDVPAAPGAPLCSCVHVQFATAVVHIEVPTALETPSAMTQPSAGWSTGSLITCERRVPQRHVQCAVRGPSTFSHGWLHPVQA